MVAWLERHQVPLYLATMVLGAALGLAFPAVTSTWEPAVPPLIAVLLWSTFLGIPLTQLGDGLRDRRFLLVLLGLNFLVVPVVAWLLTRPLTGHPELVLGVLVVLLVPCIDWVIVFAGLAGGDRARLTAAAPLLMLAQMLLLGPLLWLLAGPDVPLRIEPGPFLSALVWMLLVPLGAAVVVQLAVDVLQGPRQGADVRAHRERQPHGVARGGVRVLAQDQHADLGHRLLEGPQDLRARREGALALRMLLAQEVAHPVDRVLHGAQGLGPVLGHDLGELGAVCGIGAGHADHSRDRRPRCRGRPAALSWPRSTVAA